EESRQEHEHGAIARGQVAEVRPSWLLRQHGQHLRGDHQSPRRQEAGSQGPVHRGIHHRSPQDRGGQAGDQRLCAAEMTRHLLSLSAALGSLAFAALPAAAQTPPPAIFVSGEATVSVAPDLAQVEGGVTSEAKTAREASEANNAAMGKVLLALKGAGIDEKDYQTSRLSLQPQYAPATPNRTTPQILGYRASNRVIIKVRDVTKVANVIDTLVSAGANEIGGINFIVTQASKTLDEARTKAVADARRK